MSDMEVVNLFNSELSSLYDVKPPISKGKMTGITKAALKAVKLYKHVVQSVEKFIQKCKSEYKIPGLYVIDSIIRQSRHQYGADKDIFAGRFARNLQTTFVHIYRCPEEDKAKVIRVLNLWQKNKIFLPDVIAPLFDLADPNNPIWETMSTFVDPGGNISGINSSGNGAGSFVNNNSMNNLYMSEIQFKSHLLDYDYDEDPEDGEKVPAMTSSSSSIQAPPPPIIRAETSVPTHSTNPLAGMEAIGSILNNPEVLRQLQTLQEQMTAAAQAQAQQQQQQQLGFLTPEQERQRKLAELNKQEAAFDQRLAQTVAKTPFAVECGDFIEAQEQNKAKSPRSDGSMNFPQGGTIDQNSNQLSHSVLAPPPFFQQLATVNEQGRGSSNPFGLPINFPLIASQFASQQQQQTEQNAMAMYASQLQGDGGVFQPFPSQTPMLPFDSQGQPGTPVNNEDKDVRNIRDRNERDRNRADRRRRRSRSRDKLRRSWSKEHSPSRNRDRTRQSRSSSRNQSSTRSSKRNNRSRSRERREEKERQRKGFGVIKREHLSVCSTTLWVGHLSKLVSQEELSDTFGQYGDIVSIDMIQSRGCAFVVMNRRQDAVRALDRLKKAKLQGKEITLAWAPGKGVKGRDWKDYWEVEFGISYIPWIKLTMETDLEEFEEGGCVDESTLPVFLKNRPKKDKVEGTEEKKEGDTVAAADGSNETNNASAASGDGATGANGLKTNDVDSRNELPSGPLPVPAPVPPVMSNPTPFGMPPAVGMLGVPPNMAMNMMMPPPILGGPMGMPQFPGMMMGMMGTGNLGHNPSDPSSSSQIKSQGLLGDMPHPHLNQQLNNPSALPLTNPISITDDDERIGGDESRKRTNPERRDRERKRSRFDNPDEKFSPDRGDMDERHESPKKEIRPEEQIFDRLKSLAEGYGFNNSSAGNAEGMKMTNSLLGPPIGPPGLLGGPRGPNSFRGGFRPFMNERMPGGVGGRPWFDGGPSSGPPGSHNPFMNPSQNPFAAPNHPFMPNNENPFDVDGPPIRRPPRDRGGDRGEFFGGPNEHFNNKRGGWNREGPPVPWRGRGGGHPLRGRGGGRGGGWRPPKPHHNYIVKNS